MRKKIILVTSLLFVMIIGNAQVYEFRYNGAADVYLSYPPRGSGGRAIVHDGGNILTLNYGGDFSGGTRLGNSFFVANDGGVRAGGAIGSVNSRSSFNSYNSGLDQNLHSGWITADFGSPDYQSDRLVVGVGYGGKVIIGTHDHALNNWGGDLLLSPIMGNVGIGTFSPNEKLAVNGNIRAKEIKVEATNWPDYVFKKDYQLMPLKEVEQHIQQYGHLPDVPKAEQIEQEGLSVSEMNKLMMKKIEELTLHLIEKDKQVSDLQNQLHRLAEKINK